MLKRIEKRCFINKSVTLILFFHYYYDLTALLLLRVVSGFLLRRSLQRWLTVAMAASVAQMPWKS
ncbi:hypothetical protein ACOZ0W_003574 [Cronobacter dublinensis]